MPMRKALLFTFFASVSGCTCTLSTLLDEPFACETKDQCAKGYDCIEQVCRPEGTVVDSGKPDPDGGPFPEGEDGGPPDGGDGGELDGGDGGDGGDLDGGPPDAGDAGEVDAGPVDAGIPAFVFAPFPVVPSGICPSPKYPLSVQLKAPGGASFVAPVDVPLQFAVSPSTVQLFAWRDAGCGTPVSLDGGVVLPAGASAVDFFMLSGVNGAYTVSVGAPDVVSAQGTLNVLKAPLRLAATPGSPKPRAGECTNIQIDLYDNNMVTPRALWFDHAMTLVPSSPGLELFAGAGCTGPSNVTALPFNVGQGSATFSIRDIHGQAATVVVQSNHSAILNTQVNLFPYPAVRRGRCTLTTTASQVDCPINPPQNVLNNTAVFFQATGFQSTSQSGEVRCDLLNVSTVQCTRRVAAASFDVEIAWQTLELPDLTVSRGVTTCPSSTLAVQTLPSVANLSRSVLLSSMLRAAANISAGDFYTSRFSNPSTLEFQGTAACSNQEFSWQVLDWPGISTTHGQSGPISNGSMGFSVDAGAPKLDGGLPAWIYSQRWGSGSNNTACNMSTTGGANANAKELSVFRTPLLAECFTADIPAIAWQRIEFGARGTVQQIAAAVDGGVLAGLSPQLPVFTEASRTLIFSPNQTFGGQGMGITSYSDAGTVYVGDVVALMEPVVDGGMVTQLRFTKGRAALQGAFNAFVVEVNPTP